MDDISPALVKDALRREAFARRDALDREVRRAAASKTLRVMTWVSTVAVIGWMVGHLGELVTVLTHGGAHADHDLFQHPVHMFFANIAVPSWMATVLSILVLLITASIQAILRRVRR